MVERGERGLNGYKVHYDQVYPGIDLVFYGNPQQLEYDLIVAPGADPGQIRLSFDGVDGIRLDDEGNLVLAVAGGEIMQKAPRVFQSVEGKKRMIAGRYLLLDGGDAGGMAGIDGIGISGSVTGRAVGFALATYDPAQVLVIDPVVVYSTYLGGSDSDWGAGIAVDGAGHAYIAGHTYSVDFPTERAVYPTYGGGGGSDAFITKLDAGGRGLLYSTYLGGDDYDAARAIAIDAAGNAYVTGETRSADFPTANPIYASYRDWGDVFVTKLDPQGQGPTYSTYLGGRNTDSGYAIAVDYLGNAYVAGRSGGGDFIMINALYPSWRDGYGFLASNCSGRLA